VAYFTAGPKSSLQGTDQNLSLQHAFLRARPGTYHLAVAHYAAAMTEPDDKLVIEHLRTAGDDLVN
jgi:hypothetical protein